MKNMKVRLVTTSKFSPGLDTYDVYEYFKNSVYGLGEQEVSILKDLNISDVNSLGEVFDRVFWFGFEMEKEIALSLNRLDSFYLENLIPLNDEAKRVIDLFNWWELNIFILHKELDRDGSIIFNCVITHVADEADHDIWTALLNR